MNRAITGGKIGMAIAGLALGMSLPADAQSPMPHDMQNMPGMTMPDTRTIGGGKADELQQAPTAGDMPGMDHGQMQDNTGRAKSPAAKPDAMRMETPQQQNGDGNQKRNDTGMMPGMDQQKTPASAPGDMGNMDHGTMPGMAGRPKESTSMQGMKMGPMQGGSPSPDARDPNAYAEGTKKNSLGGMEMADDELFGRLLVNELEYADGRHEHGQNLDAEAWYGGDYNKFWIKAEGERRSGRLDTLRTEALWGRVFATYWSTQLGVRHDTGGGTARNWLAFGVQGLAPYWFETEATGYVGTGGTLAMRAEARYELLFTQRLILQPKLEANFYNKNDPARGIGSGLSDMELGLRLRYEIRRQFDPYIGVSWKHKFGNTANFARDTGKSISDTEAVAGVRIWF